MLRRRARDHPRAAFSDTLHPIYEGRGFRWRKDDAPEDALSDIVDYGRTTAGDAAGKVAAHALLPAAADRRARNCACRSAAAGNGIPPRPELKEAGQTDYVAFVNRFAADTRIGEIDGVYSHWLTAGRAASAMPISRRCASSSRPCPRGQERGSRQVAETLVEIYLGRDAGQRVLRGRILRGVAEWINAALWFSDLRSYTTITDTAAPRRSSRCSTTMPRR